MAAAERTPTLKTNLIGMDRGEMEALARDLGEPAFRGRQIYGAVYRRRLRSWDELTELSKPLRARLAERYAIEYPDVARSFVSRDGTRRYLFELPPGQKIESVFIPEPGRDTFCISSQVGCAVECLFCVTGRLPMRRNLDAGEIVGQVLRLAADRRTSERRLNVVLMGMGEPLHNYDNVMKALRIMTDDEALGLSPRRITVSTSGVVPAIERLAQEPIVPNLAISLNATTDAVRDLLIPINRKWNIARLLEACRAFPLQQRRRITFEYVLIAGVNDTDEDARRLVRLLEPFRTRVNLIPLNPDPWVPLGAPDEERVLRFQQIVAESGLKAYIRRPRGEDVSAACGMLAGREQASEDGSHRPPKPADPDAVARLPNPPAAG